MTKEQEEACIKVAKGERCKHGMIFEYCASCQEYLIPREYKVPIDIIDDDGEDKTIFMRGITMDKYYQTYRLSDGRVPKRQTTKPRFNGYKVHSVDSAIKSDPFYRRR
jgi:hypothetical protein